MFTSAKKKKEVDPILKNMEECVCFLSPRGNSVRKIAQITVGIHRTAFEGLIFGCPHLGRCGMQPVVHADDAGLLLYLVLPTLKGFGGLTGNSLVVRPAACGGQTGGVSSVRPAAATGEADDFGGSTDRSTSVRPTFIRRSDRRNIFGQTAIHRFRRYAWENIAPQLMVLWGGTNVGNKGDV